GKLVKLTGEPMSDAITASHVPNLDVVRSSPDLAGAGVELIDRPQRDKVLKKALEPVVDGYRYIFLDCPPSLDLLTVNALAAADRLIVPVQCEYYAMEGLSELMKTVELVQTHLNPKLQVEGILLTMFDQRNNLSRQVSSEVRGYFQDKVYDTVIPRH
ncbi:MAG: AAA family ATPase, partial [Pseudomonadota bacterium]